MPYALCPMPYARRVPHLSEKGYTTRSFMLCCTTRKIPKPVSMQAVTMFSGANGVYIWDVWSSGAIADSSDSVNFEKLQKQGVTMADCIPVRSTRL